MKLLKAVPSPIRINSRALQQSYSVNAFKMPYSSVRKAEISFPVDLQIFFNDSFLKTIFDVQPVLSEGHGPSESAKRDILTLTQFPKYGEN